MPMQLLLGSDAKAAIAPPPLLLLTWREIGHIRGRNEVVQEPHLGGLVPQETRQGQATLGILYVLDEKASIEEAALSERYPEYNAYKAKTWLGWVARVRLCQGDVRLSCMVFEPFVRQLLFRRARRPTRSSHSARVALALALQQQWRFCCHKTTCWHTFCQCIYCQATAAASLCQTGWMALQLRCVYESACATCVPPFESVLIRASNARRMLLRKQLNKIVRRSIPIPQLASDRNKSGSLAGNQHLAVRRALALSPTPRGSRTRSATMGAAFARRQPLHATVAGCGAFTYCGYSDTACSAVPHEGLHNIAPRRDQASQRVLPRIPSPSAQPRCQAFQHTRARLDSRRRPGAHCPLPGCPGSAFGRLDGGVVAHKTAGRLGSAAR
eukprot:364009-Chlamydomonas_euryale.AAC.5